MLQFLARRASIAAAALMCILGVLAPANDVAYARTGTVIQNYENEKLPAGATFSQTENAILSALSTRGWQLIDRKPGSIDAQYARRDFSVTINVTYSASAYSIKYKDSSGLDYKPETNKIHPNYNRWINNLRADINLLVSNATFGVPIAAPK